MRAQIYTNIYIHKVRTNLEDPVDDRSEPQQDTHLQAISSSIFLCEFELSFSSSFEKTWPDLIV